MKPDIYIDATAETLAQHNLIQIGFICASLLLSGGWTDPAKVYVPTGHGYAICDISAVQLVKSKAEEKDSDGDNTPTEEVAS